jgi:hypothetical protein
MDFSKVLAELIHTLEQEMNKKQDTEAWHNEIIKRFEEKHGKPCYRQNVAEAAEARGAYYGLRFAIEQIGQVQSQVEAKDA